MTRQAVLITGAGRRLGREMALLLAKRGYDIALHYHTARAEAETTAAEVRGHGVACALLRADLSELEALPGLAAAAVSAFPNLAHLVNNASVFERAPFMEAMPEDFARAFTVNFAAPAFLTQAFARAVHLVSNGPASVVNVLDAKVEAARHNYFFYLLSKKALLDFTLMAAEELRDYGGGIRVNAVCPAKAMRTEGHDERTPLRTTPYAVAEAVHRLIAAPRLTGEVAWVENGR